MKKTTKNILQIVATLAFLALLGWYVVSNWESFKNISIQNPWMIIAAAFCYLLNIYCIGSTFELAVEPHGVRLNKSEVFGLSALTRFSKQITPGYVSFTLRAIYLKKNYDLAYAKFSSSLIVTNIMQLVISGIFVMLIFGILYAQNGSLATGATITIIIAGIVGFLFSLYMPINWLVNITNKLYARKKMKIIERASALIVEYDKVRKHPGIFYRTILWVSLSLVTSAIGLYFLYGTLGYQISPLSALFIACFTSWSTVFSVTPSDIGIREGLMAIAATIVGVSVPITITVSLIFRILLFVLVTALSAYYAPKLLGRTILNIKSTD